jgi:hypothetical protein
MRRSGAIGLVGGLAVAVLSNAGFVLVGVLGLRFLGDVGAARRTLQEPG